MNNLLPFLLLIAVILGCGHTPSNVNTGKLAPTPTANTQPSGAKLFPPNEVCNYPDAATNPKFRALSGGQWRQFRAGGGDPNEYDCGPQTEVQLYKDGADAVHVEYAIIGEKAGAKYVALDYNAMTITPNKDEPKFRSEFIQLADNIALKALKVNLPDAAKKKIADLNSYGITGKSSDEKFEAGEGFVEIGRVKSDNGKYILVKVQIHADKALMNKE